MKKPLLLPFIALVGGAAAAVLRLLQNTTGFEEGTGLPIPGNLPATALVILLVLFGSRSDSAGPPSAAKGRPGLSRPISPPGIPVCCLCPWQACS